MISEKSKMRIRIPSEVLTLTAAAFGGTGISLLIRSVFHGFQLGFYGLLLVGCATVIVRSLPRLKAFGSAGRQDYAWIGGL
jgi:hypothetical protein